MRATGIGSAREALVPKGDGLTRTGHVLLPDQRVYYQGLADVFLHRVERHLETKDRIFGYRARYARTAARPFGKPLEQWLEWDRRVKRVASSGVNDAAVVTDVAAFLERVQHGILEKQLRDMGVTPAAAREVRSALKGLMSGADQGLTQGNDASSVLATWYLDPLDKAVVRAGYEFFRYVDDMRLFVQGEDDARLALHFLEARARSLSLNLQPGKTRILVGRQQIKQEIMDKRAQIGAVAYVYRKHRKSGLKLVRKAWRSESRRKPWSQPFVKYLLNRLRANRDDLGLTWCLKRLGTLDWLADVVGPYLSLFASRPRVQQAVESHLRSSRNVSPFEEVWLLRACLSASRVHRSFLDYAVGVVSNRNNEPGRREWAAVFLGRFGDASDLAEVSRCSSENAYIARASIVALQRVDAVSRATTYAGLVARFPDLRSLVERVKGLASPFWPICDVW